MKRFNLVMGLRKSYEYFKDQVVIAEERSHLEYLRYLRKLGFYDLTELIIAACAMYPRSVEMCKDNLEDLAYGIVNELGIGRFFLSNDDKENLAEIVRKVGREVISILEGHGYYYLRHQLPRGHDNDPHFATDLTSIVNIEKINSFTFVVKIDECHFDEIGDLSTKTGDFGRQQFRSF